MKIFNSFIIESNKKDLESLLRQYDTLDDLECDGLTRVLSYVLDINKIEHKTCIGYLHYKGQVIYHYWIELPNGDYIDYRARMWVGKSKDVPHGIFNPKDYKKINYVVTEKVDLKINKIIFNILTNNF
jgi:hypothetical protein